MYRYGFEATKEKIISEWLFQRSNKKEIEIFFREEQSFEFNKNKFDVQDLIQKNRIRPNALMLSVAASWNEKIAETVMDWFNKKLNVISGLREDGYIGYSVEQLKNKENKNAILALLQNADLGISDLSLKYVNVKNIPKEIREVLLKHQEKNEEELVNDILTTHKK